MRLGNRAMSHYHAQAKQQFGAYLRRRHGVLGRAIAAVENADHPSYPEGLDYARRDFAAIDQIFDPGPAPAR
jgi:hypothetical protein